MPGLQLPVQCGSHPTLFGNQTAHLRSLQLQSSSVAQQRSLFLKQAQNQHAKREKRAQTCRCQASDGKGKPGMLWGIRNPFHGLGFGSESAEPSQPEHETGPEQQPAPEAEQSVASAMPWKAWHEYFDEMDECAQKLEELDQSLIQATLLERFAEAAKVKKEMDTINSSDVVEEVLEEYMTAVESEDYSKAAELRDAGAAGLPGWWVAENKDDPKGHLLHVVPAFSRYVGYAFSPKDLARAEGLPIEDNLTVMQPSEDIQAVPLEEVGSPVIELFLKRGASGDLQQQGTALSISPEVLSKMQSSLATEFTALDPDKVTVEERKDAYGASVIAISVNLDESTQSVSGQSPDFSFPSSLSAMTSSGEAAGTSSSVLEADMIDLQRLPAKITQISRDELEVSLQPLTAEDQAEQERERRRELVYDSRDHDSDDDDEEEQILVSMDGNPLTVLQAAATSTSNIPGAISGVITQQIKTLMPGQVISADEIFTLVNNDKQEAADGQASASNASTSSDGTLDVSIDEIASTSGRDSDAPADDSLPSWEAVVGQVLQVVQQLKRVAPNPGDTAEEKQRHMDLMQKLDEAEETLTPKPKPTPETKSSHKSESKPQPRSSPTPQPEPSQPDHATKIEELYQALHKKQTEAASSQPSGDLQAPGNSGAEVNEIASQLAGQVIQGAITQWNSSDDSSKIMNQFRTATGEMEGKVMKYRRLNTDFVKTDPFTGLFLAAFGNHGPEVLQLQRQLDPDDDTIEWVVGTKLTGDSNVPAGEVSFKAKIGRAGRLGSADMYNPEMGVIARYKGSGCVAQTGYQQPTWVDGELLHLDGSGTRGAELGFVWNADKNSFLMAVLKRVDLNEHDN